MMSQIPRGAVIIFPKDSLLSGMIVIVKHEMAEGRLLVKNLFPEANMPCEFGILPERIPENAIVLYEQTTVTIGGQKVFVDFIRTDQQEVLVRQEGKNFFQWISFKDLADLI
jgi:hypothetical protein